jgi:beta-N-acetylglucosaminidase
MKNVNKKQMMCIAATTATLATTIVALASETIEKKRELVDINNNIKSIEQKVKEVDSKIELTGEDIKIIKARIMEIDSMLENMETKIKESESVGRARTVSQETGTPHFNPYNLLEKSNITREQAYKMLEGSKLSKASSHYVYAEEEYGVNAIMLMALTSLESGHGTSNAAVNKNNIGGIKKGDTYRYFNSWEECITYIANLLSKYYLNESGEHFEGYSVYNVNENYCTHSSWAPKIVNIANGLIAKLH